MWHKFYVLLTGAGLAVSVGCARTSPGPSTTEASAFRLNLGSFNLLRLGHGASKKPERVAALIAAAGFEAFGAVEVMTTEAALELRDEITATTGESWEVIVSKEALGESSYREYYAFYYQVSALDPVLPEAAFCRSSGAYLKSGNACVARDQGDADNPEFERDPFAVHMQANGRDFVFIVSHLYYGSASSSDVARRREEMMGIRRVMKAARNATPDADVIALGDFNLALPAADGGSAAGGPRIPEEFFSASPAVTGLISGGTTVGDSNYDHLLFFEENASTYVSGSESITTDFNPASEAERKRYKSEVSDHYPVGAVFRVGGP